MKSMVLKKTLSVLLLVAMMLNAVAVVPFSVFAEDLISASKPTSSPNKSDPSTSVDHAYEPFQAIKEYQYSEHADQVDETTILLKLAAGAPALSPVPDELAKLGVTLLRTVVDVTTPEAMEKVGTQIPYRWVVAGLKDVKATEIGLSFANVPYVLDAEYNYIRQTTALPDQTTNPLMAQQWYLNEDISACWDHLDTNGWRENLQNIVVAVIDTGVDYEHVNLRDSMWVNTGEIPNNDLDDDNNGYVDDVHGVSTIGSIYEATGDPMDNMGHGTHVAGIIAATPDKMGMVGLAHGVQIMAIKAGDGYFNDSDIIEGINYAVEMGADVINMSFGSYARSAMMEEALAIAYSSAVLVAAAGNDSTDTSMAPCYPAAYNFVIGVMAEDESGNVASFSNTDSARRNSIEYEVSAPGSRIFSTLPDDRYASWSGTSMAAPYVSAVAALLRAKYNDKSEFSTRFLMGQIVGTADMAQMGLFGSFPISVDPLKALTEIPEPDVSYYDFFIFDDPAYSEKNNGDGIIDAGETIGLGVQLRNHWGQARKTKVQLIAAMNSTDASTNPYVTWITDTIEYGDIGTFVTANNGFTYNEEGVITGIENPFMFTVADNTPNDAYLTFSVVIDCESYTELDETLVYHFEGDSFSAQVRRGVELPRKIVQDMTLKQDTYYIIAGSTLIDQGVTVTVEPGTQIQFWGDYSKELYAGTDIAQLVVDGEFIVKGTEDAPVDIFTSGSMYGMEIRIQTRNRGKISLEYCNVANPNISVTTIDHCYFTQMIFDGMYSLHKDMDGNWYSNYERPRINATSITNSIFYEMGYRLYNYDYRLEVNAQTLKGNLFDSCGLDFYDNNFSSYTDNVFLKNNRLVESQYGDRTYLTSQFNISSPFSRTNCLTPVAPVKNPETGSTYFVLTTNSLVLADEFAQTLGGHVAYLDSEDERDFVLEYIERYYTQNEELEEQLGRSLWQFYIGFYRDETGLTYVGQHPEQTWLDVKKDTAIPVISTSSWTDGNGNVYREAYLSTTHVWSNDYNNLTNRNPSDSRYTNSGVIIEVPGDISPISVAFDSDALTLPSNTESYQLGTSLFPNVEGTALTWASSDESVVTVDETGKITAHALGVAKVTVTIAGTSISAETTIVIVEYHEPTGIGDEKTEITLTKHQETYQLSPTVTPAEASPILEYASSDTSVAIVSSTGLVTALSNGTATITVSVRGTELTLSYTVTVAVPPSSITLERDYVILALDDIKKTSLAYTYEPAYATAGTPRYTSSDPSVVTVDENGVLTPVSTGNAIIYVYFSDVDMAVKARVYVAASRSEANIVDAARVSFNTSGNVLYAEDGTTYLLTAENLVGDTKFPQKLPVKTLKFTMRWSDEVAFIDTEHTLYCGNVRNYHKVDEDVADVAFASNHSNFFYLKQNGTVWYYARYTQNDPVQVDILQDIVDIEAEHSRYLFLDSTGTAWYMEYPETQTTTSFNVSMITVDGTVAKISPNFLYTTEGDAYSISWSDDSPVLEQIENLSASALKATLDVDWSEVVDIQRDNNRDRYWLLLSDGRVIFSGYYGNNSTYDKNISSLIDCSANGSWGYSFVNLPQKVAAVASGVFVLEDGSSLIFGTDLNSVLGNGQPYERHNQYLTAPVSPWIGAQNDKQKITWTSLTVSTSNGDVTLPYTDTHLDVDVGINVELSFALSKLVETDQLSNAKIYFQDAFGQKISAVARLDALGQTLIVTAVEPLKEGYEYVLTIGGCLTDAYGNTNETIRLTFSAEGTAIYEVPVEGIEYGDTESAFGLKYGDTKQLSVTVLPENASMKRIYWTTSDARVATVTSAGLVTGRHNGVATIYATAADGNFQLEFTVTVSTPPDSVVLQSEFMYMEKGETGRYMTLTVTPSYADLGELTYISLDPSIATVDENGCITAVSVGKTAVAIRSSKTGQSYFAAVEVVEENASSKILYSNWNYLNYSNAFFIAEDHTLWLINSGNTYFDNQNGYIPQNTGVKAVDAEMLGSYLYYVTDDGELYRRYIYGTGHAPEKLGDKVDSIVGYEYNDHGLFCLMTDGSVRFWHNQLNKLQICSALSNVQDIHYFNSHYFFVKNDGTVKYIEYMSSYESYYSVVNNYRDLDLPEPLIDYVRGHDGFLTENMEIYRISSNDSGLSLYSEGLTSYDAYNAIKDRIVKLVHAKDDSWSRSYLALLDDGTVAYIGERSYIPNGLMALVTQDPASDNFVVCILPGISDVVDVTPGYMVLANGSVLAYAYNNRYTNLGNNNSANNRYPVPVTAWIGAVDNRTGISIQQAQAESSTGSVSANDMLYFEGKVKANTTISLTLSDVAFYLNTEAIFLQDDFGNNIPATCVVNTTGKVLVITPSEALKDGYDYVLIIPSQTFGNHFHYYNSETYYTLTVEGTAVYDVPVTSVEPDCETSFELEFGQTAQLSVAVSPENATVKSVRWSSSNRNVATVDEDGLVTAHYNGTAVITATTKDGEMTVTFTVTVSTSPEKIYVPTEFFYMEIGETGRHLTVTATPSYADIGRLTFASMDPSIATIDENGRITAVAAGKTAVSVTLSKTGATYYATVVVVENDASAHIIQANYPARNSNVMFFIAEDHTLWMLSPGDTYFGSRNAYIPQNTGIKAMDVEMVNSYLFYVTESGELYRQYAYGTGNTPTKLGDKVASIEGSSSNGNGLFCLMTDGSVYFWHMSLEQMQPCFALSNVQEICYFDGRYFFIKNDGTVKYIQSTSDYESYYSIINNYKDVTFPEKIIGSVPGLFGFMGESKEYYYCGFDSDGDATAHTHSLTTHASYQAIADRVLKLVAAKRNDAWSNAYLALLDDGTVAFVGDYGYLPTGLRTLVTQNDPSDPFVTCILTGISDVVDVAPGYLVLSNGSVLAYAANGNNNYTILGNNNKDSGEYTVPVTAWFGAVDSRTTISIQQAQANAADGTVSANVALHFDALLKTDTAFTLTLSEIAFYSNLSGIFLQDELGGRISTVCTPDATGRVLTVTPAESLKEGYDYTLVIPARSYGNSFRYYNEAVYYSFTAEGTPTYDIPVESIEASGQTEYTLQYGETVLLSVLVGPHNASQKKVYWFSSDTNVATVDSNGRVTAYYNGTATITATTKDGRHSVTFTVTVSTPPTDVLILDELIIMKQGEAGRVVRLDVTPGYADLGVLTYESLDPTIATVDASTGAITAVAVGTTRVGVTSSKTGTTYYAEVQVKESTDSLRINALQTSHSGLALFTTEDGTVWYLSSYYGDQYLPKKAYFQAKAVYGWDHLYSRVYYITPDNALYYRDNVTNSYGYKVADRVVTAAANGSDVFYLTEDGRVYYYGSYGSYEFTSLNNIVDIAYLSCGVFVFTDNAGMVFYLYTSELDSYQTADLIFQELDCYEKVISILPHSSMLITESGLIYRFNSSSYSTDTVLADLADYQAIREDVVSVVNASYTYQHYQYAFIAQLTDGSYYYVGSGPDAPRGLRHLIKDYEINKNVYDYMVLPMQGMDGVAQIVNGYFLMKDGSVRAYNQYASTGYNSFRYMLGNNNVQNIDYLSPVTVWFGAENDGLSMNVTGIHAVTGTDSIDLYSNGFVYTLPTDFHLEITADKYIHKIHTDYVALTDVSGNRIDLEFSFVGKTLIVTVKNPEDIQTGMIYRLKLPSSAMQDLFSNGSAYFEIRFATDGDMAFKVPVTGITDTVSKISLKYNESYRFVPTVAPEDATVKDLFWHSDNPAVATVSETGVVTAGKNGTAIITATTLDGRFAYQYTVTVKTPVESFSLSSEFVLLDMNLKTSYQLNCTITPAILAGDSSLFIWSSANDSIATVDETGTVTAVSDGVTAIYCTSKDSNVTATCIVSVLSDRKIATVDRVFADAATQGVAMMAGNNLWVVNPSNIYPKLLADVSEALEKDETIVKILPVSSNNNILLVLTEKTEGEGDTQTTIGRLKTLSLSDGTFTNVSISQTNDKEPFVEENILDVIVYNNYVWVLTKNGTVWWKNFNHSNEVFRQYAQLEGITQIAMSKPYGELYMLTANGTVCYVSANSGTSSWNPVSLEDGVKITQLGLADGFLMMDETGRYYPMTTNYEIRQAVENLYGTYDFNKIKEQVVDVAVHQEYSSYTPQFIFLLSDGSLVSMGNYYNASPLYTSYSGYAWNQSPDNSYLYYIDTMTEAQVVDVGHNHILFDDGSLRLFAEGAYLGNFEYTYYHDPVSPHFAQTEQDLSRVDVSDIYFGETSANRDESNNLLLEITGPAANTIELVFTTPLLFNERLTNTVIKYQGADSTKYVNCSVTVDRHRIVITPADTLQPGVTYTITLPDNSICDVFKHVYGAMITFTVTVTVTEPAEDIGASGGSETMSTRYDDSLYPTTEYSPDLTLKELQTAARDFYVKALNTYIEEISKNINNAFLNGFANPDTTSWMDIRANYDSSGNAIGSLIGNYWGTTKVDLIDRMIYDMKDSFDYAEILYEPFLTVAPETAYPFVTSIVVKNSEGNIVSSVGLEDITVYVYFNRDMDIAVQPTVSHGSDHPFTDFMISGDWIDARTWVGTTRITAVTGSGTQYFRVSGAVAADDGWLKIGTDAERFAFTIATSGAKSMSLQANSGNGYIELEWSQDDFDTLAGYNIYRSTTADDPNSFVKINSSIILAGSERNVYVDRDVDSGVEYFYRFTVVKTDFTESEPSGSTSAASYDTTPPTVDHSVVGSTAENAGVPIIAYVHDNMNTVAFVKLYYRIKGETEFKMLEMYAHTGNQEQNNQNKYSANIPAGDVTTAGLEYYIEASDGRQSSFVGTDQSPYTISTYKLYTVTVMTTYGGKINVSALRVRAGEWVDVSTTADEGYAYLAGSLVYTDGTTETVIDGSFLMPEANITIKATFLEKSEHTMGDLNLDGKIDSADAILLLRYDAGLMQLDDEQLILADVNGDGRINVSDAREILRLDAGL